MNGSFQIGTAFGIPIRVHWTFLVLLPFFLWNPLTAPLLFGSVLLHELGHSLVARRYGIDVVDITLWPLGGLARMKDMPEDPTVEGLVAIAGPAVNFVLAALTAVLLVVAAVAAPVLAGGLFVFLWINLALGTFNLLPAFPMDGGRVVRAWLARSRDWLRATEDAVRMGRRIAIGMALLPLAGMLVHPAFGRLFCMLPVISLFVWFAGMQELVAVRLRHGLAPAGPAFAGWPPAGAAARTAEARGTAARPAAAPRRPEDRAAHGSGAAGATGAARRPAAWEPEPPPRGRGGFHEDEIAALERFRGRLRRPSQD